MRYRIARNVLAVVMIAVWSLQAEVDEKGGQPQDLPCRLDRPIPEVVLTEAQASEVLEFYREMAGKKVFVEWAALEAVGVTKATPISMHLRNLKEGTFLRLILWEGGGDRLDFVIDHQEGLVRISTAERLGLVTPAKAPAATEREREQAKRLLHTPLKWRQDKDPILDFTRVDPPPGNTRDRRESPQTLQVAAQELGPRSLLDAVAAIQELQRVCIWVDRRALKDAGIDSNATVKLRIPDVATLAEVLDVLFDAARPKTALDCGVIDNVVIISTKDGLDQLRRVAARQRTTPATRP